jgi:hypothetical protein
MIHTTHERILSLDDNCAFHYCVIPTDVQMEVSLINTKYVPGQLRLDVYNKNKWEPGTELTWSLIDEGYIEDEEIIKKAFESWSEICYVKFTKLKDGDMSALIRIGFDAKEAPWSAIGTDILDKRFTNKKTMNLFCEKRFKSLYLSIALHQIGHILGFPHEHQSPNSGIVWNEQAVYEFFESQGWDKKTIDHNILNRHRGFPGFDFDPHSIMNFGFAPNLIKEPQQFRSGLPFHEGFSEQDRKLAQKFYPFPPKKSTISVGEMVNVKLRNDDTNIIEIKNIQKEFHVSVLTNSDANVNILLKQGSEIKDSGSSKIPTPLTGSIKSKKNQNNWAVELKCVDNKSEIPVTVVVF